MLFMDLTYLSWEQVSTMLKELANKVESYQPDILVGISRGGLIPVRLLSDFLDNHNIATIKIEFYKTIGKTKKFPKLTQPLQVDITGKKVLLVDDVADTGRSLAVAKEHIKKAGAAEIRVATLHYKSKSIVKPDYFIESTEKWLVYPWEIQETKRELAKKK